MRAVFAVLGAVVVLAQGQAVSAAETSDWGRAFNVEMRTEPVYDVPVDPRTDEIRADDGTNLVMQTWTPQAKDGHIPPERVPTVIYMSPYAGGNPKGSPTMLKSVVEHGFAFSHLHVRGTAHSGGCIDQIGPLEVSDGAEVIRWIAEESPWSNGVIGGYGHSYGGGTILAVAARGDPAKTKYLKAVIAGAPAVSIYEVHSVHDGVPLLAPPAAISAVYFGYSMDPRSGPPAEGIEDRPSCWHDAVRAGADHNGDVNDWYAERESRQWVRQIRVPVFMFHGHADLNDGDGPVLVPNAQAGLFDALHPSVKKVGIFGVFGHEFPSDKDYPNIKPDAWARPDYDRMRIAWWDHWLRGIDSGVDEWPTAQVQGTDGQWRVEKDWPRTGARVGQLALGQNGSLGLVPQAGATSYKEGPPEGLNGFAPGTSVTFETGPVSDRLEITGQPVLDLWVKLDRPDAHIAARLDTFDAAGREIRSGMAYGARSAQHVEPLRDGLFMQERGVPAPVATPMRIPVRFGPTDLVVPKGGKVRLTIAGSIMQNRGALRRLTEPAIEPSFPLSYALMPTAIIQTAPSGASTRVDVLHDCILGASALRFEMPDEQPDLINVQDGTEVAPVQDQPLAQPLVSDGGGLALQRICGKRPAYPDLSAEPRSPGHAPG